MASAVTIGELLGEVLADLTTASKSFADLVDYGGVGNGVTDCHAAFVAADATALGIVLRGGSSATYKIASNITITSMLVFGHGAKLSIPTGVTVTLNGDIIAPLQQIFTLAGTGAVAFGPKVSFGRCEWFGAGQGVADDLAACTQAANACIVNHRPLRLDTNLSACPSSAFTFSDAIQFDAPSDIMITGTGASDCFVFKGGGHVEVNLPSIQSFTGAAIKQDGTGANNLPFWVINCNYINNCDTAVHQYCDGGSSVNNTFNIFMVNNVTNVWYIDGGSGVVQGCIFNSNFWDQFHYGINVASATVSCDGLKVVADSIDQNYFGNGAWVYTPLQVLVRLDFHQGAWGGNFAGWSATHNKILVGAFASCHFHFAPQFVGSGFEFWDPRLWVDFTNGGGPNYIELQGTTTWLINTAISYTITEFDASFDHFFLEVDCTGGARTVTLPPPNGSTKAITIMKTDGTGNLVTVQRTAPYVIHGVGLVGATSFTISASQMGKATLLGTGSNYHAILYKD